jgi:hypothetical protein
MRFFYYYPTFNKPSGGNKQLRLMATLLAEMGVETAIVRDRSYFDPSPVFDDDRFYGVPIPQAPFVFEEAGDHLEPEDVLILPEVLLDRTLPACAPWRCRIALNAQNGSYALRYRPADRRLAARLEFAIANAPYVAALTGTFLGVDARRIFLVPHWIVRPPFEVVEAEGKAPRPLAVCYMPRKLPELVGRVRAMVQSSHPEIPWVEIDGKPADEVARSLRENAIFFAAHDLEGCPLPGLEAMACGCLVAGFAGTARFPHPYADSANGFWAPDRDAAAAAAAIVAAIGVAQEGGERLRGCLAAGRETALRFGKPTVRGALEALIAAVGRRSYEGRAKYAPPLGWKGVLHAYRLLYNYDQLGLPGKLASRLSSATKPLRRTFSLARA